MATHDPRVESGVDQNGMPSESGTDPEVERPGDRTDRTTDLVHRARAGDVVALTPLYLRMAPALYAWASVKIPPALRGRIDPEDVVQDCWLGALERFGTFDPARGEFRAWVFGVAQNRLLRMLRTLRVDDVRRGAMRPEPERTPISDIPQDVTGVSTRLARDEHLHRFIDHVTAMEEDERKIVVCCGLEGLTAAQAAEILGVTVSAAEKRWQRARARLRADPAWHDVVA